MDKEVGALMAAPQTPFREYEFAEFRLHPGRLELTRSGRPVRLENIPLRILILLIDSAGEVVTREEIAKSIWPGSFQDMDQSLNTAVRKLRQALNDKPEDPRIIQTVTSRGYRFIAPVIVHQPGRFEPTQADGPVARRRWIPAAVGVVVLAVAAVLGFRFLGRQPGAAAPLVAVLPIEDLDSDGAQHYFSQGMTEELITQLGRSASGAFGVIAASSMLSYKGLVPPPSQVARDLGATYVVAGSVRRGSDSLRVAARLFKARDGIELWSDAFDLRREDILAGQSAVAAAIVKAVQTELGRKTQAVNPAKLAISSEAYDLYSLGRFYWNQRTETSLKQAIDYFEHTLVLAPAFAPAHAAIADSYSMLVYGCYLSPSEGFSKARAALSRAAALDPRSAEVYASQGYLNLYFDWDFVAARRNLERSIEINPSYAPGYDWLGVLLTATGQFPAARQAFAGAQRYDPASLPVRTDFGFHLHYSGRNQEALKVLRGVVDHDPNFPLAHFWMGRVLNAEGDCHGALAEFEKLPVALHEWQPLLAAQGYVAGSCGDPGLARRILQHLETLSATRFVTSYGVALIYAGLADEGNVLLWLRKALEERSHWLVWIRLDPRFHFLHADPRFQKIVSEVYPGN